MRAQYRIVFKNNTYLIDDYLLDDARDSLYSNITTVMNGSGAVIDFNETSYNVDSTKLTEATNDFVSYLGTITGDGEKVVVNGVEYSVDSTKLADAIADLYVALGDVPPEVLPITWDGNTEGLLAVRFDENLVFYKVSDMTFTDEQIKKMSYLYYDSETLEDECVCRYIDEWDWMINDGYVTDDIVNGIGIRFVRKAGAVDVDGITFPKVGVYFTKEENPKYNYSYYITSLYVN